MTGALPGDGLAQGAVGDNVPGGQDGAPGGLGGPGGARPATVVVAAGGAVLVAGILAVSFNMRSAITSLPPVFPELTTADGLSAAAESALAAVPVLSFAAFSGLAPVLARRIGEERVIGLALVLLAAGLVTRAAAPGVLLFPGTVLAACAIALVNVLIPSLIKRRWPQKAGLLIGLYLMTLTSGAVVGAVIAVPVFNVAGGGTTAVRLTLGMWALPAVAAFAVWLPQLRLRTVPDAPAASPAAGPAGRSRGVLDMARHALAWQVMAFMGLQSLAYYGTLSWFPTMFRDHGIGAVHAGDLLALMNVGNAITGLIVPVLAHRARDQRLLAVAAITLITTGEAGWIFGPNVSAVVFVCVLGLGQGAAFGLSVFLFTARAADSQAAAALSGFAQGGGYLIASAGPLLLGLLHTATGGWTVPGSLLIALAAAQVTAGVLAGRNKTVGVP